jgi:hypothetical protein
MGADTGTGCFEAAAPVRGSRATGRRPPRGAGLRRRQPGGGSPRRNRMRPSRTRSRRRTQQESVDPAVTPVPKALFSQGGDNGGGAPVVTQTESSDGPYQGTLSSHFYPPFPPACLFPSPDSLPLLRPGLRGPPFRPDRPSRQAPLPQKRSTASSAAGGQERRADKGPAGSPPRKRAEETRHRGGGVLGTVPRSGSGGPWRSWSDAAPPPLPSCRPRSAGPPCPQAQCRRNRRCVATAPRGMAFSGTYLFTNYNLPWTDS